MVLHEVGVQRPELTALIGVARLWHANLSGTKPCSGYIGAIFGLYGDYIGFMASIGLRVYSGLGFIGLRGLGGFRF